MFSVCLSYGETLEFTSHTKLPMTWRCARIMALSQLGKLKVTCRKNSCPVYNFLIENPLNFLLHTKIAYDLIIWQNFNLMSLRQILSHWKEKWKFVPDPYLTYEEELVIHTYLSHLGKFKVTCRTNAKFVSLSYLSEEKASAVFNEHRYCLWQEGVFFFI